MKRIAALLLLPLLLFAALARAVPTVEAVQAEVSAGRYDRAESMMREVVAARPDSARARYVLAEILAHNGQRDQALKEAREARRLDPAIRFTDAAKFERFEQMLQARPGSSGGAYAGPGTGTVATSPTALDPPATTTRANAAPARSEAPSSGMPSWIWLIGAVVLGLAAWRLFAARRAAPTAPMAGMPTAAGGYPPASGVGPAGYGVGPTGYGPGMQPGPVQGRGPGMLGVGLGVAGGVAAGMLAERMLHGDRGGDASTHPGGAGQGGGDAGSAGLIPGVFDDGVSDPLRDRSIDFGTGGNDWDAGGGGAADFGSDGGGGGDGDGW